MKGYSGLAPPARAGVRMRLAAQRQVLVSKSSVHSERFVDY